ncbi:hypothetical protein EON63_17940 [archaeon]|nr:MAG: hypothetical protein EON63_17940 [archaeon]
MPETVDPIIHHTLYTPITHNTPYTTLKPPQSWHLQPYHALICLMSYSAIGSSPYTHPLCFNSYAYVWCLRARKILLTSHRVNGLYEQISNQTLW